MNKMTERKGRQDGYDHGGNLAVQNVLNHPWCTFINEEIPRVKENNANK